jgi:type I restriction enzyme S subunit
MDGLNSTLIKDLNLRLPPIDLQNKFEESINNLMKQKELIAITHTNNLFHSLLQKAFKGELT